MWNRLGNAIDGYDLEHQEKPALRGRMHVDIFVGGRPAWFRTSMSTRCHAVAAVTSRVE